MDKPAVRFLFLLAAACLIQAAPGSMVSAVAQPATLFADVPFDYWAKQSIETLYSNGIAGGCGNGNYCPASTVTRGQMAVFLLRGMYGSSYSPPPATGAMFDDVPHDHWAAAWIEQLASEGITSACGDGDFCPERAVTRDQMAILLLRASAGASFTPPAASGTMFSDVPIGYWAAPWIEQLAHDGITGGCGNGRYCPGSTVTRAEMAVFLVRTFNLPAPDFETLVVLLINAERTDNGLAPLRAQPQLRAAARAHSRDMADHDYFSHTGLDGSTVTDRIARQGYASRTAGENIAAGYGTPEAAVEAWMNSPGHRANILGTAYMDVGAGYASNPASTYGSYWTAIFARPR